MNLELPEIVAIGTYNSNIAIKNRTISKNRKTTMFEIEIPIEKGGISYINSDKMEIEPDMVICAKPGQVRHTKLPFKCYYIHLIVPDGILYDNLMKIPNFVKTNTYEKYFDIFKKLCMYYDTAVDTDDIILHSLVLELVYLLINDSERLVLSGFRKDSNQKSISKVIKFIKENLTSDLSLEALADYAGFSSVYFHNFFKTSTGRTLHEYVEEQRIKKAVNMLITTDYTLAKIAYECGFSSQSYFSYAFKRKMNKTPREYAKCVFTRYEEQYEKTSR